VSATFGRKSAVTGLRLAPLGRPHQMRRPTTKHALVKKRWWIVVR